MARLVTLGDIKTRARRAADMVGSLFVSEDELNDWVNADYAELYDFLLRNTSEEWGVEPTPASISVVANTQSYSLPSNILKIRALDRYVDGEWVALERVSFDARNSDPMPNGTVSDWYGYRQMGSYLFLLPTPQSSATLRLWYVPAFGEVTEDADVLDGIDGWEEFVVVSVAARMLQKEESDASAMLRRKEELKQRIAICSDERDIAGCEVVRDVRGGWSPFDRRQW